MGIVVDERDAAVTGADLESSGHPTEPGERRDRRIERHAELVGHGQRSGGIAHVVQAAERNANLASPLTVDGESKRGRAVFAPDVDRAIAGPCCRAVGDGVVARRELRGDLVVDADDAQPGDTFEVFVEGGDDGVEAAEVFEVIDLDVGDDGGVQRQLEERAVALVGLDDEPLAARPVGAGTDFVDVAADDEARMPPRLGQHHGEHRRGRRLAVRAGHRHAAGPRADRRQHAGTAQRGNATLAGRRQLDVGDRDRR
jgi:hypothetical protein